MENELKRVECWTGFQARNYDEKRDDDGTFYYADEVDEVLASLRARLEAAEREVVAARERESEYREERDSANILIGQYDARVAELIEERDAALRERDTCKRQLGVECEAKHAALRELAEWKRECGPVLDALTGSAALCGQPVDYVNELRGQLEESNRQRDAANVLLRRARDLGLPERIAADIDAHLAASPSPLASPEGDGAGRECERPMDLIERSRADLDLMDYEGARRAQEVIHIYVCPNERCSGGLIMDGRGGVLGRCKVCNPRRAQGGDSNAEGSGA